jgi:FAD synthetase
MPASAGAPPPLDLDRAVAERAAPGGAALSAALVEKLAAALALLREAVGMYGDRAVATAFNGGKDATVVLHLIRAVLGRGGRRAADDADDAAGDQAADGGPTISHGGATVIGTKSGSERVLCMYLVEEAAFEEVDAFVRETVAAFDVDAVAQVGGFKKGIQAFVEERGVRAFVMGTRRSDPHAASMRALEPSSPGWPRFMRVNPILDWDYAHVWEFLRAFELPYCPLYDRGYTSIGNVQNTEPNPALAVRSAVESGDRDGYGDEVEVLYRPAWKLASQELERAGRLPSSVAAGMRS